jgi:hypothetical protein
MKDVGYKDLETIGWERNIFYDKPHHPLFLPPKITRKVKDKIETIMIAKKER